MQSDPDPSFVASILGCNDAVECTIDVDASTHERRRQRRGAGDHLDLAAGRDHLFDDAAAGVRQAGGAGIGDERDLLAALQRRDDELFAFALVVRVARHELRVRADAIEQGL